MQRKLMKFLHTVASAGIVGALLAYGIVLAFSPQATAAQYADMRQTISAISNYLLLPSMGIALITGLLAMVVHRPFQDMRWVWVKALLGLLLFEATFAIVQSKANTAAAVSAKIATGEAAADSLKAALSTEWTSVGAILALSVANFVLGVWRPRLGRKG